MTPASTRDEDDGAGSTSETARLPDLGDPRSHDLAGALANIDLTARLFAEGSCLLPPASVGIVSGSGEAQRFWQGELERAKPGLRAAEVYSLHEDLPVNQAFGLLLLWQRIRMHVRQGHGALFAFVFGDGSRATPWTETDFGQKPAMTTFVAEPSTDGLRHLTMVELALRYFAPVESYLRRSGFDGLVVKWGDEVQIPTRDLSGTDPRLLGADVVRFVSMRRMTEEDATSKDWVGVDAEGNVTLFIPRRPLVDMARLADRGLLQRRPEGLFGGVNLGSIAVSRRLLDALLLEFSREVNDPVADRRERPDLDPQLFTALTIAALDDAEASANAWSTAVSESPAIAALAQRMPDIVTRLRAVLTSVAAQKGGKARIVALDFEDQFWGDVGQHRQIYEFYVALNDRGPVGEVARAMAGLCGPRDASGNLICGPCVIGPDIEVSNSVLVDVRLTGRGRVVDSVLVGTTARNVEVERAFDVMSTVVDLRLPPRSGAYKVVHASGLEAGPGERWTTLFLPTRQVELRVEEVTDLRDRPRNYDLPILGNELSFAEAHRLMLAAPFERTNAHRADKIAAVRRLVLAAQGANEEAARHGQEPPKC